MSILDNSAISSFSKIERILSSVMFANTLGIHKLGKWQAGEDDDDVRRDILEGGFFLRKFYRGFY